jgi:hypothetical protein
MKKRALTQFAYLRRLSLGKIADPAAVASLIRRLFPVTTPLELIRIGGEGDGGYLIPDDLDGVVACFSPGVDVIALFEAALVARGIPCYLADASVDAAPIDDPLVHFEKKFLGVVDDPMTVTLDAWVARCVPAAGDLILQMDIEGGEWPVLLNVSDAVLRRFRIIVLELHGMERIVDRFGFSIIDAALDRLLRNYHVVHNHPNNQMDAVKLGDLVIPPLLEVTLLRKDRAAPTGFATSFPHALDRKNVEERPDLALPINWHAVAGRLPSD